MVVGAILCQGQRAVSRVLRGIASKLKPQQATLRYALTNNSGGFLHLAISGYHSFSIDFYEKFFLG
jgi:hypothetical protein